MHNGTDYDRRLRSAIIWRLARKQVAGKRVRVPPRASKKAQQPARLAKANKKIKKYRAFDRLFFGNAPFQRLVCEIAGDSTVKGMPAVQWQMMAVKKLQEEKEYFI